MDQAFKASNLEKKQNKLENGRAAWGQGPGLGMALGPRARAPPSPSLHPQFV